MMVQDFASSFILQVKISYIFSYTCRKFIEEYHLYLYNIRGVRNRAMMVSYKASSFINLFYYYFLLLNTVFLLKYKHIFCQDCAGVVTMLLLFV